MERDSAGKAAGKGPLIQTELSATLGVSQDQTLIQPAAVDVYNQEVTGEVAASLTAAAGGTNTSGPKVIAAGFKAGNGDKAAGIGYEDEKSPTLASSPSGTNQVPSVVFGMSAFDSNAMKSANPNSGIYRADTARTLDNNGGNPACNQGGMIVLEGNGARDSHKGDGYAESDIMYTLNTVEQHAVLAVENYPADSRVKVSEDGIVQTLSSWMGTGGGNVPLCIELT